MQAEVPAVRDRCERVAPEGPGSDLGDARYAVGIVNHRTYDDLKLCLESVKSQRCAPARVVVVDSDGDPRELEAMASLHPEVHWEAIVNLGFAGGANAVLDCIEKCAPETDFALILNPDVDLEPDFAAAVLEEMTQRPRVALATGKLLRPDRRDIDSAGIVMPRSRRPRDRGSEQADRGQYERTEFVFGASGAALMLRRGVLADLAIDGEIFDEDFFLYHEDTDLAWRANLLGWRVLYVPAARAMHRRRWRREDRFRTPEWVRRHSFKNHYLQIIKNERPGDFWINLPVIAFWELVRLGFALLRDPAVLRGYRDAWRLAPRAWRKRRILQRRVRERLGR
jgi:GT2 family glycosyltransferase